MTNEYTYELKHVTKTLTMSNMCEINQYYEAACTAEFILDNLEDFNLPLDMTKETALQFGYDVRHQMDKYGYSEEDAISQVISDYRK